MEWLGINTKGEEKVFKINNNVDLKKYFYMGNKYIWVGNSKL